MTIELSNDEVNLLMMELGYVAAAHAQKEGFIPMYLKKLTDKIIVQTGGKPYWMKEKVEVKGSVVFREEPATTGQVQVLKPGDLK